MWHKLKQRRLWRNVEVVKQSTQYTYYQRLKKQIWRKGIIHHRVNSSIYLTFRSPHQIKGLSEDCRTNSSIRLSHFLLLLNDVSSSFQPLFGTYVFNKRTVLNSANITRPSGSCFEAVYSEQNTISHELNGIHIPSIKHTRAKIIHLVSYGIIRSIRVCLKQIKYKSSKGHTKSNSISNFWYRAKILSKLEWMQ